MKKMSLVLILMIFVFSTVNAQFIRGWGLKAGATFAKQDWEYATIGSDLLNPDNRTGLNAGIFVELLNVPVISVVGELNYVQKGIKGSNFLTTEANPAGALTDYDIRIDYINISALAKLRYSLGFIAPYIVAGPKVDIEASKVLSVDVVNTVTDSFKKERLGLKVGFGTEVNLLAVTLLAEFIYDADFNALYENNDLKVNTNSFDLRIGIMF